MPSTLPIKVRFPNADWGDPLDCHSTSDYCTCWE